MIPDDLISVIVSTSVVPSHPSTERIEETLGMIREQLPSADILIACDGVRPEQEHRLEAYGQFLQRLLWKCNFDWHNVLPVVCDEWVHQAETTKAALKHVRTPLVLFVEHDRPPIGDIPWEAMCRAVQTNEVNLIRLHPEAEIHPAHKHLMLKRKQVEGIPLLQTYAWWQHPHLVRADWYRQILEAYCPPTDRTMIEDRLYGLVESAFVDHGTVGWGKWKLWIYAPAGNIKRSTHFDAREDDPKWPSTPPPTP